MRRINETSQSSVNPYFDLPMDLIADILSWLPVKSLLRFKSVCKTWYSLIENPNFTKQHLRRSHGNPDLSITSVLVTAYGLETEQCSMLLKFKDETSVEYPNFRFDLYPRIVGICDGLVCMTFMNLEIIVCNPIIGKDRRIPNCGLLAVGPSLVFFGFRFQGTTGHSLFRIIYSCSKSGEIVVRGEVYTLSTDVWREIEVKRGEIKNPVQLTPGWSEMPVDINGVFYWEAFESNVACITSFDTRSNLFGKIKCPKSFVAGHADICNLMDMKGELALTVCYFNGALDLWILDGKGSWTMKFRVENLPEIGLGRRGVGRDGNGKLVMQQYLPKSNKKLLFTYDPKSHQIEDLPFSGPLKYHGFYLFRESLLSV